jgi:outer membrane protein OmpA-like peptidoglycan-associated protein
VARLEERLMADIRVSDEDLGELMQARARAVQRALLESGKVPAERVAIVGPKPVNRSVTGAARANFSLE